MVLLTGAQKKVLNFLQDVGKCNDFSKTLAKSVLLIREMCKHLFTFLRLKTCYISA